MFSNLLFSTSIRSSARVFSGVSNGKKMRLDVQKIVNVNGGRVRKSILYSKVSRPHLYKNKFAMINNAHLNKHMKKTSPSYLTKKHLCQESPNLSTISAESNKSIIAESKINNQNITDVSLKTGLPVIEESNVNLETLGKQKKNQSTWSIESYFSRLFSAIPKS